MSKYSTLQKRLSYTLKAIVIVSAFLGTFLSAYGGKDSFMGGSRVFMYFTIQSNIAIAIICAIGFYNMSQGKPGKVWAVIKLVGTVSITLTGIVFCFILAPTMGSLSWKLPNILTHIVVPIASAVDFFVEGQGFIIEKRSVFYVVIPPALYVIYAGVGYILGWKFTESTIYPYFFLNWGSPAGAIGFTDTLPFMGCLWWIFAAFVFLILVGLLYLWVLKLLMKKKR